MIYTRCSEGGDLHVQKENYTVMDDGVFRSRCGACGRRIICPNLGEFWQLEEHIIPEEEELD